MEQKKEARKPWTLREFGGKTLWDWLQLLSVLAIPVVLAAAGFYFEAQLDQRQRQIENQRAKAERELAEQRAQDEALQAYLDQMNNLVLEHDLRGSKVGSEVRTLARARTLTVLGSLDPSRKTAVMQFLVEGQLVQRIEGREPIISLSQYAVFGYPALSDESGSVRRGHLIFDVGKVTGVDLSGVELSNANLSGAQLFAADLSDTDLTNADLREADLTYANLTKADLTYANLTKADLGFANLSEADLANADLEGARNVTEEQLAQASSLIGATMPNGQKYEDWLKSREEDGENGSPS